MGVVVAHRAVDLAQQGLRGKLFSLPMQTIDQVGHLFSHSGGGGGLAVGAAQHGLVGQVMGQFADRLDQLIHLRQQYLAAALPQHQGMGEVVNVLRGTGEMDEFTDCLQLDITGDLLLEEILHRLDVVVGGPLDVLDPLGIFFGEIRDDTFQDVVGVLAQRRHLGYPRMVRQGLQPAYLHQYAMVDQTVFTEDGAQICALAAVAAVDGGDCGKGRELHGA